MRRKLLVMVELLHPSCCTSVHQQHTTCQACNPFVINNSLMPCSLNHNRFPRFDLNCLLWFWFGSQTVINQVSLNDQCYGRQQVMTWLSCILTKNCLSPNIKKKTNYQVNSWMFTEVHIGYIMLSCWQGPTAPPHPDSVMQHLVMMLTTSHIKLIWVQK